MTFLSLLEFEGELEHGDGDRPSVKSEAVVFTCKHSVPTVAVRPQVCRYFLRGYV